MQKTIVTKPARGYLTVNQTSMHAETSVVKNGELAVSAMDYATGQISLGSNRVKNHTSGGEGGPQSRTRKAMSQHIRKKYIDWSLRFLAFPALSFADGRPTRSPWDRIGARTRSAESDNTPRGNIPTNTGQAGTRRGPEATVGSGEKAPGLNALSLNFSKNDY